MGTVNSYLGLKIRVQMTGVHHPADSLHGHIVVAEDLTTSPQTRSFEETSRGPDALLCLGHAFRFSAKELNPAGRTASVSSAREPLQIAFTSQKPHCASVESAVHRTRARGCIEWCPR